VINKSDNPIDENKRSEELHRIRFLQKQQDITDNYTQEICYNRGHLAGFNLGIERVNNILTEYDKSIKEMIEQGLTSLNFAKMEYEKELFPIKHIINIETRKLKNEIKEILIKISCLNELLSKIGDNSEVKE
jgi:hypothetical protein